jgi:hypothetical protein
MSYLLFCLCHKCSPLALIRISICLGRAMAQAVSLWTFTTEARVHARVSPCGFCGRQYSTGTGFSPSSFFPCQHHSTVALHTYI